MKKWKIYQFGLFTACCILLNVGGRMLADHLALPLWLDSLGTVLCAYLAGPVCGAIVGAAGNLIHGMMDHSSLFYALTSIALGVIVGLSARKKRLDTMFGTMTVISLCTLAAVAVSVPLNLIFTEGMTGNVWGDGVIAYLLEKGFPAPLCSVLGQFYLDFVDKLLTLLCLYAALRLFRWLRKRPLRPKAETAPKVISLLLAALLLGELLPLPSRAEETDADYNDYVQTIYSSSNGLPCGEANDIAQTEDGILWVGTYAGLYRYNGREFRWMDYESVRNVNCLYADAEGRLWIGTNDNGFSIAINEEIVNVVDSTKGLPSNSVRSIIQSADGYYYVGTTGSMDVFTMLSGIKKANTLREINYADQIAADQEGRVAAVTSNGRLFLLRGGQILSSLQIPGGGEIFKSCEFDAAGTLLAGTTANRIYLFDVSGDYFVETGAIECGNLRNLTDLARQENGQIFITADNGVGYLTEDGAFRTINTNDFNNSIDNMQVDYQGNLWFASSRLGLLRMAPSAFRDVYGTVGLPSRVVNTVVRWGEGYYIGTDKGLDAVDAACKNRVENDLTRELEGVRIRCMTVAADGSLWICTYGSGLMEISPTGEKHLYNADNGGFGSRARVVTQLSDGTILAAGDTGLSFIRDHAVIHTVRDAGGQINSMILTVTEREDGTILAGTDGDGIAVLRDGEVERMLTRADGLSSEVILRTVADPASQGVFIVTSNGLCYMDEEGGIRALDNFPYFNNYDIWAKNENTLYVMSSAGIYVVDREELLSGAKDMGYDLLDARRGLNSAITANSWNYFDGESNLFLPCDTGVYVIDTDRYNAGSRMYRMSIATVRLDGQNTLLDRSGPIRIARSVHKIELFPEIINFTIQDPYVGYLLEGFDKEWTILPQSSLNSISYANLDPGEYTFRLAVLDSSRQNVVSERTYTLTVEREIYDQPAFMVYLLLVPMIAVAWLTWFIVRTGVQRTLDLQRRELAMAQQEVQMGNETIFAIAKAVDAKDERTSQHSQRVSQYSVLIAKALGLSDEECENLRKTALMHDIGKIGIPDSILNKPARLTDEEYAVMKSHVTRGADILKDFTLLDHVVEGARYHHERYDGRGYPEGLKGKDIPLYGRIIGVADAFDAMTANRVYRKQMDFDYVLNEMKKGRGTQFDPDIDDVFLGLIEDGTIDIKKMYAAPEKAVQTQPRQEVQA